MYIIPKEILFLIQVFGMFPMKYTKNTREELNIEFCPNIFRWGFILIPFLSIGSCFSLFLDTAEFFNNGRSHVTSITGVVAAIASSIPQNIMIVVFFITAYRNYPKYIEMSRILDKIDTDLHLKIKDPKSSFKFIFTYMSMSTLIGIAFYNDFHKNPLLCSNSYSRCIYYFQATLLVHFTFVVETITIRFRMINEKIQEEILRPSILQLLTDLALSNSHSSYSGVLSQETRIEILIDSYYQLAEAVENARWFFDNQLFATITCSFISNTTALYYFFGVVKIKEFSQIKNLVLQGGWVSCHLAHMILLFMPSTSLTQLVKETAQIVCQLIHWETNNAKVKSQLATFLYQLLHNDSIEFTALGMFKIHGSILVSIASSVTTYMVIMLQF